MNVTERVFLTAVKNGCDRHGYASRKDLPLADRKSDRVRQKLRSAGLIMFESGWDHPAGWVITDAGRAALETKGE